MGYRSVYSVDPETGLKQGAYREYNAEGGLILEENYVDNVLEGEKLMYNPDGSIAVREHHTAGVFDGPYTSYDEQGRIRLSGRYTEGEATGVWYGYYPNGSLEEEVTFEANVEHGPFREWYEDGRPKASGSYIEGDNEHGTLHLYTESGDLERVMNCERGRCQTFWTPDSTGVAPEVVDMTPPRYAAGRGLMYRPTRVREFQPPGSARVMAPNPPLA